MALSDDSKKREVVEEVEMNDHKLTTVPTHQARLSESEDEDAGPELGQKHATMNPTMWVACIALSVCYTTAFQQHMCTSSIVKHIDAALGPTTYYNWMITSYTISTAVSTPMCGGLSDIFGRKGFFIVGSCISLVGTIVALAAQNVPMVIAGMILKGIGAGSQQLAIAAIAEIVPNKHRGHAQAILDLVTLPWTVFGPLIGNAMVKYTKLSFRVNFIIGILLNLISIVGIIFFYFPPPGRHVLAGKSRWKQLAELDWIGVGLMTVGIVLTLVGLSFGGGMFKWTSPGVILPIVIGFGSLFALGFWEWKFAKHPFFAHELFIGKPFALLLCLTFIGGMSMYTAGAFWTQQAQGMFTSDPLIIGLSALSGGMGGAIGGFIGGMIIGKSKFLKSNYVLVYAAATKLISDILFTTLNPTRFVAAMGFAFMAMFGMGVMMVSLIVCVQLSCDDKHIGLATLVLGSVRSIGGSVAVVTYSSIMQNTVKKDAPVRVAKAIIPLGAPLSVLGKLIKLLAGGRPKEAAKLPGVTTQILDAAKWALRWSWSLAFQRIYYCAIVFTVIALIGSFFVKDLTDRMTDSVAVTLTNDHTAAKAKKLEDV